VTTQKYPVSKIVKFQKKYDPHVNNVIRKKLKYFSNINLITAIKQPPNERYRMTTETMCNTTGGLPRLDDEHYEEEFSAPPELATGTPRPGMNKEKAAALQEAAGRAMWSFSQAAKQSASALKRRRSPNSRTFYRMAASKQVKLAFDELQKKIEKNPEIMSQADFQLLKQAFGNFRIKLNVHDSKSHDELKQMQAQTKTEEQAAELATQKEFTNKSGSDEAYINAKDTYLDLKAWGCELTKEVRRTAPKFHYASMGGGLFRHDANQPSTPAEVPSQHAQIAPASGTYLRTILKPETIRRTFISLSTLTNSIRNDVAEFLTDESRHKDRHEVVKQIKECCIAAAKQKKH